MKPSMVMDRTDAHWAVWLHRAAIVLATVVLLAGKVTTGRLSPGSALPDIDIRLAALVAALLFELYYVFKVRAQVRWKDRNLLLVVLPLLLFVGYCVVAEVVAWGEGFQSPFFSDLFYLVLLVLVFGLLFRGDDDLFILALTIEVVAIALFILLQSQPGGAAGGAAEQFSTSVTTFRIELVGLCAALYLFYRSSGRGWQVVHALIAICTIYAALSSTSRTSILVLPGLLLAFVLYFMVYGRWLVVCTVSGAILIGTFLFAVVSPSHDGLLQEVLAVAVAAPPTVDSLAGGSAGGLLYDPISSAVIELNDPAFMQYCEEYLQAVSDVLVTARRFSCSHYVAIPDSTHRLRMMAEALNTLAAHPLFGAGADGFRLTLAYGASEAATYTYPHNLPLDIAARTGLIGVLFLTFSAVAIVAILIRATIYSPNIIFLCGIPLVYAMASLTAGDIYDARPIWAVTAAVSAVCGTFLVTRAVPVAAKRTA